MCACRLNPLCKTANCWVCCCCCRFEVSHFTQWLSNVLLQQCRPGRWCVKTAFGLHVIKCNHIKTATMFVFFFQSSLRVTQPSYELPRHCWDSTHTMQGLLLAFIDWAQWGFVPPPWVGGGREKSITCKRTVLRLCNCLWQLNRGRLDWFQPPIGSRRGTNVHVICC